MKAFYKGFINGVRCCTIICASITGAMGAMCVCLWVFR